MTILEFIRKNSFLVLIVIFGVGAGLVVMDYAGKGSAFSQDYYIKVNGTRYDYADTMQLGENGKEYLASLVRATRQVVDQFDVNEDGQFDENEAAALQAWQNEHPEFEQFYGLLNHIYSMWNYGQADHDSDNVGIVRALLKAAADELGLHPSEEQIDNYLRSMPVFKQKDGTFNMELYHRLTGFRHGVANRKQEELFRDVIADMIRWEALQAIVMDGVAYNTKAQLEQLNSFLQSASGRTAWLPTSAVPTPAEPTEDELKAYWETHKEAYKSDERRIVSIYTLSPAKESNMENLLSTTDMIMQDLSLANGQGLDKLLKEAANNPEYDPFNYLQEDGSTHITYDLATRAELKDRLAEIVNYDGNETPLAEVAFAEVKEAPGAADYKAATEKGTADKLVSIKQIRGPYITNDEKIKLIRVEAIEAPGTLPYEEARSKALADCRTERAEQALQTAAEKLYSEMQTTLADKSIQEAFKLAAEAGAQVEMYGPLNMADLSTTLPSGMTDANILSTPSGKLMPLAVLPDGARISSVDKRTVEDSPALAMQKRLYRLPLENMRLRRFMMQEWLNAAYTRYNVQLSPHVRLRGNTTED